MFLSYLAGVKPEKPTSVTHKIIALTPGKFRIQIQLHCLLNKIKEKSWINKTKASLTAGQWQTFEVSVQLYSAMCGRSNYQCNVFPIR